MEEKLKLIAAIFSDPQNEDSPEDTPDQHGKYYGGIYNGRKYMYSLHMIETLPIERLEHVIKKQTGYNNL